MGHCEKSETCRSDTRSGPSGLAPRSRLWFAAVLCSIQPAFIHALSTRFISKVIGID